MNKKSLNDYDFLVFLEIHNPKETERKRVQTKLSELIWETFVNNHLEQELGVEGINLINQLGNNGATTEEILYAIIERIPKIKLIFNEIASEIKKELIRNYLHEQLDKYNSKQSDQSISPKDRQKASQFKDKYSVALKFFETEDWNKLSKTLAPDG